MDYQARTNGVTTRYGYDGRGMISTVLHEKSGQSLAFREYWRDNRDRIVAWKRGTANIPNGMETGRGDRYAYDAEGQLTQASYRAFLGPEPELTPSDAKRSDSFQYDALGNRYGSNRIASRGIYLDFTRRNNGLNQYLMWSPYSAIYHDDNWFSPWVFPGNGVMMADGYITASYNALNQPVAIGSQGLGTNFYWFWHDPLGRCVKRWLGNGSGVPTSAITYLYYDGWSLVQEGPNASTADRLYVHGGRVDEILASKIGGQWYNHQYDARGHCILLTNSGGAIQEQYDYDAFGMPYSYNAAGTSLGNFGGVGNRFLFTGREWIKDLRIYDYRHRMYQPELGRFLQPDPKQFEAGDYNLYRYCHNDPINKTDPSGLEVQASLEYYIIGSAPIQGSYAHQNLVLHDTVTGETVIGRGLPSEKFIDRGLRSAMNLAEQSATGEGNKKLNMHVVPGTKNVDPYEGEKTETVKGSQITLKGDMESAKAALNRTAEAINRARFDYRPQSVNSNAAAATAYQVVTGQAAPSSKLIPGSQNSLLKKP